MCTIMCFLLHSTLYIKPTCCEKWQNMWASRSLVNFIQIVMFLHQIDKGGTIKGKKKLNSEAGQSGQKEIWHCWSSIFPTTSTIIKCLSFSIGNSECHLLQVSRNETVTKLGITFHKGFQTPINLNRLETSPPA